MKTTLTILLCVLLSGCASGGYIHTAIGGQVGPVYIQTEIVGYDNRRDPVYYAPDRGAGQVRCQGGYNSGCYVRRAR